MSAVRRLVRRLAAFLRPGRADAELTRELSAHRTLFEDELRRRGLTADEVRLAADRAFTGVEAAKDAQRDTRSFPWLEDARRDLRHAARLLAAHPASTIAIVLTLALGIGVASAVFSLVQAVVLRPLDYEHPESLVQLFETGTREGGEADWVSFPNYRDWQRGNRVFESIAAYRYQLLTLTGAGSAESIIGLETTSNLFDLLGVPPLVGRTFGPGEALPRTSRVAIISHGLWLARFGGEPGAIGRQLTLDGAVYDVVGVMPPWFRFPASVSVGGATPPPIDLWIPVRPSEDLEDRGSHNYWAIGRLKPGVSLAQARAEMAAIADGLAELHPVSNKNFTVTVQPLKAYVAGAARPALLALLGAVGFVLLLMCANIANLLLGRAESRRHEMAMRQALGASRWRLVRQSLTESLLLASAGATLGLLVAYQAVRLLVRLAPSSIARLEQTSLDWHVLSFMAVVTMVVGVLFGLAPAIVGSSRAVPQQLKDGLRVSGSPAGRRIRQSLVLVQLSLAVVLLVGAGLLLRSFVKVAGVDIGIQPAHVLTGIVTLSPARYGDASRQAEVIDRMLRRVQTLRGVRSAAVSQTVPLTGINDQGGIAIEGRPDPPPGVSGPHANRPHVSPGYFDAMGIRPLDGRIFDVRDDADAEPVAIVSDLAARTYWPGTNPIGKRVAVNWTSAGPEWRQIVGIVQSTRHFGIEAPQKPEVYVPYAQAPFPYVTLIVRTEGNPTGMIETVRNAIAAMVRTCPSRGSVPWTISCRRPPPAGDSRRSSSASLPGWRCCWRRLASTA
jgi:putative ABC transport system permease protein